MNKKLNIYKREDGSYGVGIKVENPEPGLDFERPLSLQEKKKWAGRTMMYSDGPMGLYTLKQARSRAHLLFGYASLNREPKNG